MVQSKTTTANAYLAELPDERRVVIAAVRKMILKHLPKGFEETMHVVEAFLETADQHIPFLLRKAERVEEYLQQR